MRRWPRSLDSERLSSWIEGRSYRVFAPPWWRVDRWLAWILWLRHHAGTADILLANQEREQDNGVHTVRVVAEVRT